MSNMPEMSSNDSSAIICSHRPSCDGQLLDAINSETLHEAMALLTSENSFTQEGLNQALIYACRRGHKLLVQTLVRAGSNIEHRDEHGNTPLLICAENGFTDTVRFLVSRHANINAVNSVGNTALILSVRPAGSTDFTKFLLEQQDIDIHLENQHGQTALLQATHFMDVDTMRLLLQKSMERNTVQACGDISMIRQEKDFSFYNSRSQEIMHQIIIKRTGLTAVYNILQKHLTTQTSPLELAIKAGDTKSLDIFLDCQFSSMEEKKRFIDCALKYVFENNWYKSGERFSSTDVTIIQKLLQYGADVNPCDGPKLISLAVESGNIQLVELLCIHGADLATHYTGKQDPLCIAAEKGRRDLIELLLKYKTDVITFHFYNSALDCALRNDHTDCAKLLIQSGAQMDVRYALNSAIDNQMPKYFYFIVENYNREVMDYFSKNCLKARNLLTSAVESGNFEIIGQILDAGVDVNEADSSGQTPLMASKYGEVAEFLIQKGANVNRKIKYENGIKTALSHMIGYKELSDASTVELCKTLIQNGALVNFRNGKDQTPLMLAAYLADCVSMLQMLLENGADVNDKDSEGNTALFHAVKAQRSKNVTCLIDSVRDKESLINVQNNDGLTPLIVSVQEGNVPIVKELIERGADVNMKDNKGNSVLPHLLIYCRQNEEEILTSLLEAGSHVNCQNSNGLSALMFAVKNTKVSLISPLLDAGADVNAVSKRNTSETALSFLHEYLYILIIENQVNVIPKLIQHGLGPADIETNKTDDRINVSGLHSPVSPLLVALLGSQLHLAHYFVDILYLTSSDLSMFASHEAVVHLLQQDDLDDSLSFLQELCSQPMSLVKLCLVRVSAAVGSSPGRETRVDSLPLPQMIKDRLLFKSIAGEHAALAEILSESNSLFESDIDVEDDDDDYSFYESDPSDSSDYGY